MSPTLHFQDARQAAVEQAVRRAADYLVAQQNEAGYWCALLTADTTLESDYILTQLWMHPPQGKRWDPPTRPLIDKAVASIFQRQLDDGGFNICVHGPSDVSASVKAYFALKVAGVPADDPRMAALRNRILELGGIQAANSYVKINLNLFDLYPREAVPTVPPEIILLGDALYEMSSWTRAIVVSLALVQAHNPRRPAPEGFTIAELFKPGVDPGFRWDPGFSWRNCFLAVDRLFKFWEKHAPGAIRRKAIRECEAWMIERFEGSDGLAAIYPPMMYAIMALDLLGYKPDHPLRRRAVQQFEGLMVDDGRTGICGEKFFFQPCFSPIWDTSIAAFALGEAGSGGHPAMQRAADWMLSKEIRRKGDWAVKRRDTPPSGWAFEFNNEFYPDIDDTAMVMLALKHSKSGNAAAQEACEKRALNWLLAMQSKDGGWAAFDVDNDWHFLSDVPFADHNAMLDPTCPDITGRVLESLCAYGLDRSQAAVKRAVDYLVRTQEPDGSWYGRWGVAYIYGTCFALRGLKAAGEDDREAHILRAGEWLRSIQNADGGWGELTQSYDRGTFTGTASTPSQTAWAILGLLAGGDTTSESVRRGVDYLARTQRADGTWHEEIATGTGFPRVFYLNYHLYRHYFPLLALGTYQKVRDVSHLDRL